MKEKIKHLRKLVEKLYLQIYYLSEKEFISDEILRKKIDISVKTLIKNYKIYQNDLKTTTSVEWIYYNDIVSFWEDTQKRKNIRHAWLILSEYIPNMYIEISKLEHLSP